VNHYKRTFLFKFSPHVSTRWMVCCPKLHPRIHTFHVPHFDNNVTTIFRTLNKRVLRFLPRHRDLGTICKSHPHFKLFLRLTEMNTIMYSNNGGLPNQSTIRQTIHLYLPTTTAGHEHIPRPFSFRVFLSIVLNSIDYNKQPTHTSI
jgi:hypothetical protein